MNKAEVGINMFGSSINNTTQMEHKYIDKNYLETTIIIRSEMSNDLHELVAENPINLRELTDTANKIIEEIVLENFKADIVFINSKAKI